MSEVYHLIGPFEGDIQGCTVGCDSFIDLDAPRVEFALESVDVLVVGFEIEEANLVVLARSA
jgi:hypothetical protein